MTNFHYVPVAVDRARQRTIAAVIWMGLGSIAIFLFFFNPASASNQWFPKCPFRMITGWQCPGCGSTRACYQLLHLHPVAAFKLNPDGDDVAVHRLRIPRFHEERDYG